MLELANEAMQLLNQGGVMLGLVIAVIALATEKIVPGPRYSAALKRIAELEYRLDRQLVTTERAVSTTEAVVGNNNGGSTRRLD